MPCHSRLHSSLPPVLPGPLISFHLITMMFAPQTQQPRNKQPEHHDQAVTQTTTCTTPTMTLLAKRERPYRQKITRQLQLRISKAVQQRLYLVAIEQQPPPSVAASARADAQQHHNPLVSIADQHVERCCSTTFVVLGSTCNVYHVQIRNLPCCSCPDFQSKGVGNCKHIFLS